MSKVSELLSRMAARGVKTAKAQGVVISALVKEAPNGALYSVVRVQGHGGKPFSKSPATLGRIFEHADEYRKVLDAAPADDRAGIFVDGNINGSRFDFIMAHAETIADACLKADDALSTAIAERSAKLAAAAAAETPKA